MKKIICMMVVCLFSQGALAEIYKWKDSEGNTHYSDKPHHGAKTVHLPKPQTYTPPKVNTNAEEGIPPLLEKKDKPLTLLSRYESLHIVQPKDDQPIRSNNGNIVVKVAVKPELNKADRVAVYLDATAVGESVSKTEINLQNIDRGTHKVQAKIIDKSGHVLVESTTVTFHLLRHHISGIHKAVITSSDGRTLRAYG